MRITDSGSVRALRDEKSWRFKERPVATLFEQFTDREIIPTLIPPPKKRDEWRLTIIQCCYAVVRSALRGCAVADSRDYHGAPRLRIRCWDDLGKAGWVRMAVGSEKSRRVTRYIPTKKLLVKRRFWQLDMLESHSDVSALVVLRTGKRHWLTGEKIPPHRRRAVSVHERIELTAERDVRDYRKPDPRAIQNGLEYFSRIEAIIDFINRNNLAHSWVAFHTIKSVNGKPRRVAFQPSVVLRQIHSRNLFNAARLFTTTAFGLQSIPSAQRADIQIDGQPVVEWDFACLHIRMLYHLLHLDPKGDLYRPDSVLPGIHRVHSTATLRVSARTLIKNATNAMLNTTTRGAACKAVAKLLWQSDHNLRDAICATEKWRLSSRGDYIAVAGNLLSRIEEAHVALMQRKKLYTGAGYELMTVEGRIMLHILSRFADMNKPALGIHDSLLVKAEDSKLARRVMTDVYGTFFPGHRPLLK